MSRTPSVLNRPACRLLPELNQCQHATFRAALLLFGKGTDFTVADFISEVEKDETFLANFLKTSGLKRLYPVNVGQLLFAICAKTPMLMSARRYFGNKKKFVVLVEESEVVDLKWRNPDQTIPLSNRKVSLQYRVSELDAKVDSLRTQFLKVSERVEIAINALHRLEVHLIPAGQRYAGQTEGRMVSPGPNPQSIPRANAGAVSGRFTRFAEEEIGGKEDEA